METPGTTDTIAAPVASPTVVTVVMARRAEGLSAVLDAVGAQVYDSNALFVVHPDRIDLDDRVTWAGSLAGVLANLERDVAYVWVVDQDAQPRPDALAALVTASEQVGASVAGSKLLQIQRPDELVSVGAATDVFAMPYSGLEEGEVDQEQYDVVRDVAFVEPASVLIRRDLLAGLGGLDSLVPFEAAGIDLCLRARLAGGRVIVVPSAEALYAGSYSERTLTWREQAGRTRAILKAYSGLTLLWVLPGLFAIGLVMAVYRSFRGRVWALPEWAVAWGWNLLHIGSTVQERIKARRSRQAGDDELFLYQVTGSVELKRLASGLSARIAGDDDGDADERFFDEMMAAPAFWQQPAFLGVMFAVLFVLFLTRSIWTDGVPVVGFSLPLRESALDALRAYAGGWNPAGLGTPEPLHPAFGFVSTFQFVFRTNPALTATLLTVGSVALGMTGMARITRPLGVGPYARYLAGAAVVAGPAAETIAGDGYWPGLLAIGLVPWATALVVVTSPSAPRSRINRAAKAVLVIGALGMLAPVALFVPLVATVVWAFTTRRILIIPFAATVTVMASVFLFPWLAFNDIGSIFGAGAPLHFDPPWWTAAAAAGTALLTVAVADRRIQHIATWGAVLVVLGAFAGRSAELGAGRELTVAGMLAASLGFGLVAAAGMSAVRNLDGAATARRLVARLAVLGAVGMLALTTLSVPPGRAGLPGDAFTDAFAFTRSRASAHGSDRVLVVGPSGTLPGDVRRLSDGTAYRVFGGPLPHLDEAWLSTPRLGDDALAAQLEALGAAGELRPGAALADFGIRWVVFTGESNFEAVFDSQLDLRPLPQLDVTAFENEMLSPRAATLDGVPWRWTPPGYTGPAVSGRVRVAENADPDWGPGPWGQSGWANEVDGSTGEATFAPSGSARAMAVGAAVVAVAAIAIVALVRPPAGRDGEREALASVDAVDGDDADGAPTPESAAAGAGDVEPDDDGQQPDDVDLPDQPDDAAEAADPDAANTGLDIAGAGGSLEEAGRGDRRPETEAATEPPDVGPPGAADVSDPDTSGTQPDDDVDGESNPDQGP